MAPFEGESIMLGGDLNVYMNSILDKLGSKFKCYKHDKGTTCMSRQKVQTNLAVDSFCVSIISLSYQSVSMQKGPGHSISLYNHIWCGIKG